MERKISVIGLGYVGLPVAVAFGQEHRVVAFDIDINRIQELSQGYDRTGEVSSEELALSDLHITSNVADLSKANFHIVAVPTPINSANQPDLSPLLSASKTVGRQLKKGDIVVYESTVYPGATEEECVPILESNSGLACGKDFFVGYSPERINPGDKEHTFTKIRKIVSGQNKVVLKIISEVYSSVVVAGVFEASSIKVAEAAKVIENTQRDINIAFINELAMIFGKMDISVNEVLEAAATKWNFLNFKPGLVGGHCIGVDPYYLTYKAGMLGYHPEVILAGRRVNDGMGKYIAELTVKRILEQKKSIDNITVGILGFTFKENCPDVRNTKVIDIIRELSEYHIGTVVCDPVADKDASLNEYGVQLVDRQKLDMVDVVILAVAHDVFCNAEYQQILDESQVIIDIKNICSKSINKVREQVVIL